MVEFRVTIINVPKRANIPLQDIDRHVLTEGAMSSPQCQI